MLFIIGDSGLLRAQQASQLDFRRKFNEWLNCFGIPHGSDLHVQTKKHSRHCDTHLPGVYTYSSQPSGHLFTL